MRRFSKMSNFSFIIENKEFFIPKNYLTNTNFTVKSSPKNYELIIDKNEPIKYIINLLEENNKNVLFIDKNVFSLYFSNLNLEGKNIYIFEAIEKNKDIEHALELISYLENICFTKAEKLIVVGGGIVEDIGAFVGATFKRGINWIFFPTTLLSMCDSCIGGKTGLNYKGVKNQVALFSSPYKVVLNTNFIKTLNHNEIRSGLGEISKLCITGGEHFFNLYNSIVINGKVDSFDDYLKLILSALYVKKAVIEEDEFEFNYRKSLNYGHTLGHAIEKEMNFSLYHGECVVLGMIAALNICVELGTITAEERDDALKTFALYEFPDHVTGIKIDDVVAVSKNDKKMDAGKVKFILLKSVGDAYIDRDITDDQMRRALEGVIR